MYRPAQLLILALAVTSSGGCYDLLPDQPPERPQPQYASRAYVLPKVEFADGSQGTIEKDGIKITVTLLPFSVEKRFVRRTVMPLGTPPVISESCPTGCSHYEIRGTPGLVVTPASLRFKLKVTNNLDHVFRFAGAVLSYTVSGKQLAIDKTAREAYEEEFRAGIIRPKSELEFDLAGPKTGDLPDQAKLSLNLDDVVTETDAAGNPTKRTSFEWVIDITKEKKQFPFALEVITQEAILSEGEYREMAAKFRRCEGAPGSPGC